MKIQIGEDWPFGVLTLLVGAPIVGVLLYLFYDVLSEPMSLVKLVLSMSLGVALGLAIEWFQKKRRARGEDNLNG